MLAFFAKKKTSPDTPPEEVIQDAKPPQSEQIGDDFIFIERRPGNPATGPMYPPMPPGPYGMPYPAPMYPPTSHGPSTIVTTTPVPYIEGVPFELAPQLSTTNSLDLIQLQVDGILAVMTRQMSIDEQDLYNFSLERSVQQESQVY